MCINKNVCKGKKVVPWFQISLGLYLNTFNIFIKMYINTQQHNHARTIHMLLFFCWLPCYFMKWWMIISMFSFIALISNLVHPTICCLTIGYIGMSPIFVTYSQCVTLQPIISRTKWIAHLFSNYSLNWMFAK